MAINGNVKSAQDNIKLGLKDAFTQSMHPVIYKTTILLLCILLLSPAYSYAGMIIDLGQTSSHATTNNDINYDAKSVVLAYKWSTGIELSGGSLFDAPQRAATWASVSYVLTDPHLFAGIGVAVDNHITSTLTSKMLFQTQAGFHYHHWRILVRHLSNAGLKGENIGETMILVGWEF
ncbi:MAG: hypothetical protein WBR29_03660 [Gammaproteobacteria bacterium]